MPSLEKITAFVKKQLQGETTGHDFYHGQRVAHLALKMYLADHPQAKRTSRVALIIQAGGLLHDTIDEKICPEPQKVISQIKVLLAAAGFEKLEIADILFSIQHLSFAKNIEHHYQLPMTGQYIQDADRLEALGAIGIARAFTYGGRHGNLIYDPELQTVKLVSHDQYRQHKETTINHFYEKLFHLKDLMNTTAGQREASRRTQYMQDFVAEFMAEWRV